MLNVNSDTNSSSANGTNKVIQLSIPAIKCQSCVETINQVLTDNPDIHRCKVYLESKKALIETELPVSELINLVKSVGFSATIID